MAIRFFSGVYFLQDTVYFRSSGDDYPWIGPVIGVLFGGFFLFLLINGIIKNRKNASTPRRFNYFMIRKIANSYGLDKPQRKLLESIFRNDAVTDPVAVIQSTPLLDKHFKRAYQRIENSEEDEAEIQRQLSLLFSIRNSIEATQNTTGTATSTRQIPANMAAMLSVAKETYPVRVINTKGDAILVESPKNSLGAPIKIPGGSRVSLSFFTKSNKEYSFDSKILGAADTPKGPAIRLAHAAKVKPLAHRMFRRKQTSVNCNFFMVIVKEIKVRRKIVRKMSLDGRSYSGTIMDISIGGCSIRTSVNIQAGARIKIEFTHGTSMAALGQVIRVNSGGMYATIHVKFIKIPRSTRNSINAMVFEYNF
jgi:hypothetical protein